MAAIVVRRINLSNVLSTFDEAREERQKDNEFRKFSKATDKENFVLTKLLARKPVRFAFIGFHKPSLEGTSIRRNHGNEYNYLTKFLSERVSWIARDATQAGNGGDGRCDIIFSHQDMYPLTDTLDYFEKLKRGKGRFNTRANWEHVGNLVGEPHTNETGTHLADIAASAFHRAVEPKEHGMTDERFFNNLSKKVYRGRDNNPFGLKLWPLSAISLSQADGRLDFLRTL